MQRTVKDGPKSGVVGTCDKEILNAGTYTYTITTPATDVYEAGSRTYTVTVNKAEAVIKENHLQQSIICPEN